MSNTGKELYEFGPFLLDPVKRILLRDNQPVPLQLKAFETLLVLVRNGDQVVLKQELMQAVWPDTFVEEGNLTQSIFVLRKTLGAMNGNQRYIETIPGRGYRLAVKVRTVAEEASPEQTIAPGIPTTVAKEISPWAWPVVAVVAAAVIGSGLYWRSLRAPKKLTEKDTIVLAEFSNVTGDPVFDGTLRQGLSAQLEQSPFMNLLSDQRTVQILSLMAQPKDARLTPELAREVCQRTGSTAVLDGSIAQVGTRYLLVLKAISCATGESLTRVEAQAANKDSVLDTLATLASLVRSKLGESLASVQKYDAPPEDVTTSSLQALQSYSLGYRTMIAKNDYPAAIPFFQQAISLDPNFAMAYARLGINFYNLDEPARAEENLQKAYELRERLSEREKLYIAASHDAMAIGNMEAARKTYELWRQLYPRDQFAIGNLGVVYGFLGEHTKALSAIDEAWTLNPGNALVFANLISCYLNLNLFAEAQATALKAPPLNLGSNFLAANLYLVDFAQHDSKGMEKAAGELLGKPGWEDLILYYQSDSAAYEGQFSHARDFTRRAVDSAKRADKKETAATYEAESAVREALVQNFSPATQQAKNALALSSGKEVLALAGIALGLAGDSVESARLAHDLNRRFPQDTVVQSNLLPAVLLAAALHDRNAAKLNEQLDSRPPYELGQVSISVTFSLYLSYLRGQAYLTANRRLEAAREFQTILDHPGLVRNAPIGALAHLGLARAYASEDNRGKSKAAYEDFFALWKDADSDVPILRQASADYEHLR
jgi:DNA-binding winged helix-turn-helix (wHTH) protein/tetratricopeptide (TPR) repeat protein